MAGKTEPPRPRPRHTARELTLRSFSALVLGILALGSLAAGPVAFAIVCLALCGMAQLEWNRLTPGTGCEHAGLIGWTLALAALTSGMATDWSWTGQAALGGFGLVAALHGTQTWPHMLACWGRWLWLTLGTAWLLVLHTAVLTPAWLPLSGGTLVLWLFVVVWSSDTGAWLFGKWIGGPRLAPRLSPNKTWAGTLGGWAAGTACGAGMVAILSDSAGVVWTPVLLGSFAISLATLAGDLLVSKAKRQAGVRDSGTLIPGHGGVLDRIDGLLGAVWALALLCLVP